MSHTWGCLYLGVQELTSLAGKLNLVTTYSGRRRSFSRRCYKRTCEVITIICLHTHETFLPEYEYHYFLSGNNKFVLCHDLGPIQLQQASQEAKKCACRPKSFVKLCNKKYSSCNIEQLYCVEYLSLFWNVISNKEKNVKQSTRYVSVFFSRI